MPQYQEATEARRIADRLIPLHHAHLLNNRVRMEYVFSDQKIKTEGKYKFAETKRVVNLNAFLAGDPAEQHYSPYAFVCVKCRQWKTDEEREWIELDGTLYEVCDMCKAALPTDQIEKPSHAFIANFEKWKEAAQHIEDGGKPDDGKGMFVILIYKMYWDRVSENLKQIIIDRQLSACWSELSRDQTTRLVIKRPDVVEYSEIIQRYGLDWREELRRTREALRMFLQNGGQLNLDVQLAADFDGDGDDATDDEETIGAATGEPSQENDILEPWNRNRTYELGERCSHEGSVFKSKINQNLGFDPFDCPNYWAVADEQDPAAPKLDLVDTAEAQEPVKAEDADGNAEAPGGPATAGGGRKRGNGKAAA